MESGRILAHRFEICECGWEPKRGFQQFSDPQWESGARYARDNFIELFVVQYISLPNEDLMKLRGSEKGQRETGGRCNNKNKRFYDAGNGNGIFFIWGVLLVVEVQDLNIEWYVKVTAAVQNIISVTMSPMMRKRANIKTPLYHFLKRVDRIESSEQNLYHHHKA